MGFNPYIQPQELHPPQRPIRRLIHDRQIHLDLKANQNHRLFQKN